MFVVAFHNFSVQGGHYYAFQIMSTTIEFIVRRLTTNEQCQHFRPNCALFKHCGGVPHYFVMNFVCGKALYLGYFTIYKLDFNFDWILI